jgi:arylsulfatase A-like enzyme
VHGATDEWSHRAVEDIVHHYDWHATLLHCFGLEHAGLQFVRAGRQETITAGQEARVVTELLA